MEEQEAVFEQRSFRQEDGIKQQHPLPPPPAGLASFSSSSVLLSKDGDEETFVRLDSVEWGPRPGEDGYDTDQELVPRPNKMRSREACHCRCQPGACSDLSCILFACNEECSGRNCPAGQHCGNQRIQKRQFKDVEVFDAGLKGQGLRCLEDIKAGEIVCEYTGRAVKESKLKQLFRRYQFDRRLYIMGLGYGVYLDARHKGGLARYVNHSCQPNCRVDRWNVKGILRAVVVALHDVPAGTELTFDYQWERKRGRAPTKCHCGSANCRGTLEVKKSLEESNLEEQLQGHWERLSSQVSLDHTIVNRTIQVKDQATEEYFLGEITGYNPETGQHSVLYRHDMSEAWEDLAGEDWMILNAKMDENFMIAKKRQRVTNSPQDTKRLLSQSMPNGGAISGPVKNYLYIQTQVKNALYGKHLIEMCQRNCSVQILCQQLGPPTHPPRSGYDHE
jgi:histone-lysine N-methyltransferase SETD2